MLRLGTVEPATDASSRRADSPALVTRALGDLVLERHSGGAGDIGFAIEALSAALVETRARAGQDLVDRLLACGVGVEALYDTYFPRVAAHLGALWVDDRLSFTGVTLGMTRLTEVFRTISPAFLRARQSRTPIQATGRKALLALAPGETHALGVVMAADYLRSAGWSVQVELRSDASALERIVGDQAFDVVGLSAGSRRMLHDLLALIDRLRAATAPCTRLALGGPLLALEPTLATQVGGDVTLCDTPKSIDDLANAA